MTPRSASVANPARSSRSARTAAATPAWPTPARASKYRAICADPPWHFKIRGRQTAEYRGPEKHYPVLGLAALKTIPVADWAARNCHLFLWTTGPHLPQAIDLMEAWGFAYSGIAFSWVKLRSTVTGGLWGVTDFHVGLGYTTRHNVELVLLGRRGNPDRLAKDVRELVISPLREHSRKPNEVYAKIERYCPGPRLELFARGPRRRWDVWGNESADHRPIVADARRDRRVP
jgi:N6-adenosine-specific RNA methylase IME4